MMRPLRFVQVLQAGVVAAAALAACAPLQVSTYTRLDADGSRYRTYQWQPTGPRWVGDPRLDGQSVFETCVTAMIDEQLRIRGLEPASAGMADVLVRWTARSEQRAYLADGTISPQCRDCAIAVFDEGTLVIDLVDARTHQLIWRGWATRAIDGTVADQARMEQQIHEAVGRILDRLPRGIGRTRSLL